MLHQLTWQQAGQSDEQLREFFMPALVDLGVSVTIQDSSHAYLYVTNLPDCWASNFGTDPDDTTLFGDDIAKKLSALKSGISSVGSKGQVEVAVGHDQVFEFRVQGFARENGAVHLVTTIVDRSEERHRERLLRALLREVSHRSKNLLAIIQSIALQTARYSGSLDLFLQKFRGRLYSLSQSQDLITDSSWRGAYFFDLVRHQTEKYIPENKYLIDVSGDNILLTPNASLHLGLALHELVVNAVSHGSLMRGGRGVTVTCTRTLLDGQDAVEILWDEPLDNAERASAGMESIKAHFGSTVLERVVPASVNGKAEYAISGDKIQYRLVFPIELGD